MAVSGSPKRGFFGNLSSRRRERQKVENYACESLPRHPAGLGLHPSSRRINRDGIPSGLSLSHGGSFLLAWCVLPPPVQPDSGPPVLLNCAKMPRHLLNLREFRAESAAAHRPDLIPD